MYHEKIQHPLEINPYTLTIYQDIHNDEKLEAVTLQRQKYGYVSAAVFMGDGLLR